MKTQVTEMTEAQAISALNKLAKAWPSTLWLFAASNTLNVMRTMPNGGQAVTVGGGMAPEFCIATISIPSDGGDW